MKICVFGLWHLGCVTAACLAKLGHQVIGLDNQSVFIEDLRKGKAPIFEPGLDELIQDNLNKGLLQFTHDPESALRTSDVLWVTFDTPVDENDEADISSVIQSFETISPYINDQTCIIISSQVPVGATRQMREKFQINYSQKTCFFAYSPENLRLGKAIKVFLEPDRIIIGTLLNEKEKYFPVFSSISERLEWMSTESAEMTKHAINAFLATSVTFANEIGSLCEHVGAQAKEVERGLKTEERIGPKAYLGPGNAYSGGTLGRDIKFLQRLGENASFPAYLINSVTDSNNYHKHWIQRKCLEVMGSLTGKQILVLGLTYKPGTDTLRRSLSVELCKWLKEKGAIVTAFDPKIAKIPPEFEYCFSLADNALDALQTSDCIIVATEWPDFKEINLKALRHIEEKIFIDPTGLLEQKMGDFHNIHYYSVGRSY